MDSHTVNRQLLLPFKAQWANTPLNFIARRIAFDKINPRFFYNKNCLKFNNADKMANKNRQRWNITRFSAHERYLSKYIQQIACVY